jgi:chorismate--pyruvate lyase
MTVSGFGMNARSPMRPSASLWRARPLLVEPEMRAWLLDAGSLTARIRARCPNFNVHLLWQGPTRLCGDEAPLLGLRRR